MTEETHNNYLRLSTIILAYFLHTLLISSLLCFSATGLQGETIMGKLRPTYLRCEYRIDPLGIDIQEPRLSWVPVASDPELRGVSQSAYRILVAGSKELLSKEQGDLWDSGKVKSDETAQIAYAGQALVSNKDYWWSVQVWDQDGKASGWSEPARWSTGLLSKEDWKAKWIAYDEPSEKELAKAEPVNTDDCVWVWYPEGDPRQQAPQGDVFFRRVVDLGKVADIQLARMVLTADNYFKLSVNGEELGNSADHRKFFEFEIGEQLQDGENTFAICAINGSDSPAGLIGALQVEYASGKSLHVPIDASWKCYENEVEGWSQPGFDDSGWVQAKVIAKLGDTPWNEIQPAETLFLPPPPYLRKDFSVDKPVVRATVFASALGIYEIKCNGKKIGADYFTPGWTDYHTRVYYNTYDVTDLVQEGENTLGAILADGWYAGHVGWGQIRGRYGKDPRFMAQLMLEHPDGSSTVIGTDESWKAAYGAIDEADFLMGEAYDARLEEKVDGWDCPGFDDKDWAKVSTPEVEDMLVEAYPGVTVQEIMEIPAKSISEPQPGVYVYDLGQNLVGGIRLKISGDAGSKITIRYAEVLNSDGTPYTINLRGARTIDSYTLKGDGVECWEPRFTFHGFRFVELTGCDTPPALDAVTGVVLHSDAPMTGILETSNPMVNQLIHNIEWGQRGNYLEVPTDCPQRDERLGWTGDAQVFIHTGAYNMDVAAFFTKWLIDLDDSRNEAGAYAHVAPDIGVGHDSPGWGDAAIICPYYLYQMYGDKRIIERHYDSMAGYIEYLEKNSENLIRPAIGFGDWVSLNADTPKDVISTAYFAYVTNLMSELAGVIGREDDAKKYKELFEEIKAAFNKEFVKKDGRIEGGTQTCYLLALYKDLLPEAMRPAAMRHLIRDLMARGWHHSVGFLGVRILLPTLSRFGRDDVAYRLLLNDTYPSWGYEVKNGATTIWERWDGWTDEFGFQDPGMNSFNHYAFGSVGEWLYATMAGIEPAEASFKRVRIRPNTGGDLTHVNARYNSIRGWIGSEWDQQGESFVLKVRIPENTTAEIHVPTFNAAQVSEGKTPASEAAGIKFLRMEDGAAVFETGSGVYCFTSKP